MAAEPWEYPTSEPLRRTSRLGQLAELGVFLFLIVPSMVFAYFALGQATASFTLVATSSIVRDLALLSLVFYFVWRNREPIARLGWDFRNAGRDVPLGILLFPLFTVATGLLDSALRRLGLSGTSGPMASFLVPHSPAEFVLAGILVVVVAIVEETLFRGYLMLRIGGLSRSPALAVVLSSIIFSLGHGYEGASGVITVGVMGAIFALVYLWRGNLAAPMTMHFLQDFIGIILVPLLRLH